MSRETARYRLEPQADADIEAIWAYSFSHWGKRQAHRYAARLKSAFEMLAAHPQLAPACDGIREGYRCHHVGKHKVYYRETDYGISVVRVLHERMSATGRFSG